MSDSKPEQSSAAERAEVENSHRGASGITLGGIEPEPRWVTLLWIVVPLVFFGAIIWWRWPRG